MTGGFIALEIPFMEPVQAFQAYRDAPVAALLDSAADVGGRGRYAYIAADPVQVLEPRPGIDPFDDIADALADSLGGPPPPARAGLPPFQGGAVGILGYELGRWIERLPEPRAGGLAFPDMLVGIYDTVAAYDLRLRRAWVIAVGEAPGRRPPDQRAEEMSARLTATPPLASPNLARTAWTADQTRPEFEDRIRRTIDYIYAGDIFQANIAQRFTADLPSGADAFDLYQSLRTQSKAPFAAYLGCGNGRAVVSASPERFLSLSAGGIIETRPIKGTRPRGASAAADAALARELVDSEKDRAENLMIVDLLRNDISRVARVGTVEVTKLYELETFARVHHLVSEVRAGIDTGHGAIDLLRAAFPGGSITGAPKVRAMEIIHELEPVPRGPYCGAVVWIGFNGAMDSSIVIRTLTVSDGRVAAQAGGGIVADSGPAAEYDETLTKIRPLLAALDPTIDL